MSWYRLLLSQKVFDQQIFDGFTIAKAQLSPCCYL